MSFGCEASRIKRLARRKAPSMTRKPLVIHSPCAMHWCPIALWVGDLPSAERFLALLRDHLAKHRMTVMNPLCSCLVGVLLVKQGQFTGLGLIQTALNKLREAWFHTRFPAYHAALAHGLSANIDKYRTSRGTHQTPRLVACRAA